MEERGVLMSRRDLKRWKVMETVIEKGLKQKKAAEILELSLRQVKRLVKRLREEGAKGIIHRGRGRVSNRKHTKEFKSRVLSRCRKAYEGFGPTLASEKLLERDHLKVNRETLRQWLMEEGLWRKRHKGWVHREWRARKACFGEMVQMDGSHHDWLEGRGPKLVLMGYIDDATGKVFGRFYDYEGTMPALDSFCRYARQYGLPLSLYLDKHSTYKGWAKELTIAEELAGREEPVSEFGRAMEGLEVKLIHANSPQAKGRVERLFGTFQDRLVKEMRLENIKTREEANEFLRKYLPVYNRRFSRKAQSEGNLHRPVPKDLNQILSIRTIHRLRNDNTIRHQNGYYQILGVWKNRRPKELLVEERIDGKLYIMDRGKALAYREIPKRLAVTQKPKKSKIYKPQSVPMSHPYKRRSFQRYLATLQQKQAA